ncbi:MAG: hypothetical protein VYA80_01860 [Pseudomonadota bacterium]|nr:hypothetical protein [Pseudomonadota bacterium]
MSISIETNEKPIPYRMWWGFAFCAFAMGLMFAFAPYSANLEFAPDKEQNFWYYWQLQEPTFMTRLSAWLPYFIHQISMWFLIYQAKHIRPKYIFGLHQFNLWALGINGFFIIAHMIQTKYFYDGLAQDVHEATSMMSVVIMLFMIMIMENNRRGLFFGHGVKAMYGIGATLRRYHGYYFSWAITYTFWYHPFEMTSGHIAGFAYMFLLMLQGSLFFTRFHTNRVWTVLLELLFVVHGAIVAAFIMNPGEHEFWSMFLFGGVATFLITQMHGLSLTNKQKLSIAAVLFVAITPFYWINPEYLSGVARMPMIMYIGSAICFLLLLGLRFGWRVISPSPK